MPIKNINDLDNKIKKKKIFNIIKILLWESYRFIMIFLFLFIFVVVVVNFNVFYFSIKESFYFNSSYATNIELIDKNMVNINSFLKQNEEKSTDDSFQKLKNQKIQEIVTNKLLNLKSTKSKNEENLDMKNYLISKVRNYEFNFNLLPPDNRIIIESINVNSPIVNLTFMDSKKFDNADFDEELFQGVVKYPHTPNPGEIGNSLIFGHTSFYWWKKNKYGEVFSKIPKLKQGDIIKVLWKGRIIQYKVDGSKVVWPSKVADTYKQYSSGEFLTLMGCYPIGTNSQRILVFGEKINNEGYISKN